MIKVALIGAGFIAQTHANTIEKIKNAKIVATADKVEEKGKKLAQSCNAKYYKDIDEVVRVSDKVGIGKLVARVVPLAVMKG